jgi:hypothetical protein
MLLLAKSPLVLQSRGNLPWPANCIPLVHLVSKGRARLFSEHHLETASFLSVIYGLSRSGSEMVTPPYEKPAGLSQNWISNNRVSNRPQVWFAISYCVGIFGLTFR